MAELPRQSNGPGLVQLVLRDATRERVARGAPPVFELDLLPNERIVGVEHYWTSDYRTRSTVDHHAKVWVAAYLGAPDA
jgi:hypothetical protein